LGKHALDLAARGSFKLLPPSEVSQVMINFFCTYNEEERILKVLKSSKDTFRRKVYMCTNKLPNRQNMEFLEDFAIEKLGLVENDIAAMIDKLDIFKIILRRDDESIEDVQGRTNHVCDLCKLASASKMKTKKKPLEKIEKEKKERRE
jgi:hypothetical protein